MAGQEGLIFLLINLCGRLWRLVVCSIVAESVHARLRGETNVAVAWSGIIKSSCELFLARVESNGTIENRDRKCRAECDLKDVSFIM